MKGAPDVAPGRVVAFDVVQAVGDGEFLDRAFARAAADLTPQERRWARECAYGVFRHRGRLDHLLGLRLRRALPDLDPPVRDLLRVGAYQLLHMGSVPDYAAVSQSVDQARRVAGRGAAGLVNAVLRGVARAGLDPALFPDRSAEPASFLASWHSHPEWLVRRWLDRWPVDRVEALLEANNVVPPLALHPLGVDPEQAMALLGEGTTLAGHGSGCVQLAPGADPVQALSVVRGVVQDPGAALVTRYADVPRGWPVLDLCAAPGGKAFVLAEEAEFVVAADRSSRRLERLREPAERLGSRVHRVVADARRPAFGVARAVLIDVPCSGTGTLRRRPDLKWRLGPDDLESLVELQRGILEGAASVVAPGGLLVYSTCTLEPEENAEQVTWFLDRHDDFRLEPTDRVAPELRPGGTLVVMPQDTGFDGAFAARLRRES